ncbi:maternal protein tudor isoform X2 [Sitodiplosis mosellana]|uniref:maternal protein tudor isoform X2 n=1 Tax=Sitodiplosis mosellana TaxID=263140 RepID=UPI002444EBF2|nr:maternal protein tudor isoform X2 [Sitodiplosis mosellana]XP_055320903.1 maternal protein tudor isoform X2 [Sitodiplosis mosellana]XP_055320904.1 maternal protein tudor isoform X2 [Sitodiplosis mosellana]
MDMENLTVTRCKPFRGFLEIYGHKKPELLDHLDSEIAAYQPHTKKKIALHPGDLHPNLEFDTVYLALSVGKNKYHRCTVLEKRAHNKVTIELIDYGIEYDVDASLLLELDLMNQKGVFLRDFPPIATKYILANFFCLWKLNELIIIESLLKNSVLPITNEQTDREHRYISLSCNGIDLATKLINSQVGMEISFTEQRIEVRKLTQRFDAFANSAATANGAGSPARREKRRNLVATRPLQAPANNNSITITNHGKQLIQSYIAPKTMRASFQPDTYPTDVVPLPPPTGRMPAFTANELPPNLYHPVYVSYIENGPNEFYIQLKSQEHVLDRLSSDLSSAPRVQLMSKMPINMTCIGMACIARFSEDQSLYRAVIHKVHTNGCRVIFVDFGNSELVPLSELYEIPSHFLEHKTFAMPFELHGCKELGPIDDHLKKSFSDLVTNATLDLKVIPTTKSTAQQCELFLPNGHNVLHQLMEKKIELSSFPNPPHLKDGDIVCIRSAVTAKKFFVQRVKDMPAFDRMMDALLAHCHGAHQMVTLPAKDACCAAMVNGDTTEWYRVIVTNQVDREHVQVYVVDYGHEMKCHLSNLREITPYFFELPRQAIECCLTAFEEIVDLPESTREKIELFIDDPSGEPIEYRVSMHRSSSNSVYVVDLTNDAKEISVSLSVYKLAMPRRNFGNKAPSKPTTEIEKPLRATSTAAVVAPMNRGANNWPNVREIDGAETQERYNEAIERQNERFGKRNQNMVERFEQAKPRSDNLTKSPMNNGATRNYGNRPEYDNRRNGDMNKNKSPEKINNNNNNNHNKPSIPTITTEDFVGFNPTLPDSIPIPLNSITKVNVVEWHSPLEFYVQLKSMDSKCDDMMYQIQKYYRKRAPIQHKVAVGSLVLVRHKADNVIKRAKVIEYNEQRDKYRVQFIDYGAKVVCQLSNMYELEKSFIKLPAMAICCTFGNVILNKPVLEVHEKVHPYIDGIDEFECTVVANVHDKLTIELIANGINLKDLLMRDQFLTNLPKDICLERLVGQTLTVFITAATDLSRFHAMFYGCDIAFMCSYKDLSLVKKNPQLNEQFRAYEKKYVQIKVESIDSDNILKTSIYLPHLDDDEDVPDICNFPIYSDEFDGFVPYVEPPYTVYIQSKRFELSASDLLDQLYAAYESDASQKLALNFKQTYAALSADGNVYRCQIEQINADNTVAVRWIDYGNKEVVEKSAVKALPEQFKAPISALAQKMFVPIKLLAENISLLDLDWATEKKVKILGTHQSNFICELMSNGSSMIAALEKEGAATKLNVEQFKELFEVTEKQHQWNVLEQSVQEEQQPTSTQAQQSVQKDVEPQKQIEVSQHPIQSNAVEEPVQAEQSTLEQEPIAEENKSVNERIAESVQSKFVQRELIFVTHVDHPNRFYIQLNSDTDELESFQQTLQIVGPQLPPLNSFRAGVLCIGKYTFDDQWYRARIIDSDSEITSIQFVDYGNTDSITDNSLLKSITDNSLIAREPFAMACSLPIAPHGSNEWTEAACNKLRMLTNDSPMEFELVSKDKDVNYVKLFFVGGRDLVKEMIQEEVADPLEIIKTGETCFVSHINSLGDFFIQVDSDTEVLRKIEQHLASDNDSVVLTSPTVGTICSALFDDGAWYRARILNILPDSKYDVEFLDYGNTFQTTEVRSLSPEITQLPHLRKRCYLKLPDDVENWSDEAERKFREISGEGASEFNVNLIKPGKKACIELWLGDQNQSSVLGEMCEKRRMPVITEDEHDGTPKEVTSPQQHSINVSDFPSGKHACCLTHANSISDFYIQFYSKSEDLTAIQTELANAKEYEALEPTNVPVGTIVAALYPEDDYFYRAKVLEHTPNGTVVMFIDYGNTSTITEIRMLSSILSTIVPLAAHCTLANDQLKQFTPSDVAGFMNFMLEVPEPTFQVEAISTTGTKTTVKFFRDDCDILEFIQSVGSHIDPAATSVLSDIIEQSINSTAE